MVGHNKPSDTDYLFEPNLCPVAGCMREADPRNKVRVCRLHETDYNNGRPFRDVPRRYNDDFLLIELEWLQLTFKYPPEMISEWLNMTVGAITRRLVRLADAGDELASRLVSTWINESAKERRANGNVLTEDDKRHGTTNGYQNYKCRCAACTDAQRRAVAGQRAKRKEAA